MNNSILKTNARNNMQKNHFLCVAVAFFMSMGASGISIPTLNLSSDYSSTTTPDIFSSQPFEIPGFGEFFSNPTTSPITTIVVISALVGIVLSSLLKIFIFNTFSVGGTRFFLKLRKDHPVSFAEVFENLKDKSFLNIAKVSFIRDIYISLFYLLLIIPGIIKGYQYWAVKYILSVRPDTDYQDALRLSKDIMKGHKLDLFVLELSFLGWQFLGLFTCGLLNIFYVAPYMQATFAEFYSYVREDAIARSVITPFDIPDYEPYISPVPSAPFYSTSYGMNMPPQGFAQPQNFSQPQDLSQPQDPVTAEETPEIIEEPQPVETPEKKAIPETPEKPEEAPYTTPTSDE